MNHEIAPSMLNTSRNIPAQVSAERGKSSGTRVFRFNPGVFLLMFCMFASGACGLVMEYIQATIATYILGNSIEQFGIVIGLMLFMMGIAGTVQRFFRSEKLVETFILIEILLAIIGGYAPIATYWAYGFMEEHFLLVQYAFIMSIGFLIGLELPVVLRINRGYAEKLSVNIGQMFSADYIGSLAGALLWVYVFIKRFPLTEISFLLAGINFAIAVFTYFYFRYKTLIPKKRWIVFLIGCTSLSVAFGLVNNRSWNVRLEENLYRDKVVLAETTKYQHLVLTENKTLKEYRFYINGNLQFSSIDERMYHEILVHPVMSLVPDHASVLVLGGGDGLAMREILKYDDVSRVKLVDIDPEMIRLFTENPLLVKLNGGAFNDKRVVVETGTGISDSEIESPVYQETGNTKNGKPEVRQTAKVRLITIDADRFLSTTRKKWNVIISDLPDPSSIELTKLYSREFYMKIRNILSEKGMLVVQATSPYHARESFLCIRRTIEAAGFRTIPYHLNVPSFGDWGFILAWKDTLTEAPVLNRIRQMEFHIPTAFLTPMVFRSALVFGKNMLVSKNENINTLMYPVLLDYYLNESWLVE